MALKTNHQTGDAIKADDMNSQALATIQNAHNIFQLFLENFFASKITPFLGLFFDGFSDTTKADINTNTTIDTTNKKLDLDATFTSGTHESITTSFQQSMKTVKLWVVRRAGTTNTNSIDLEKDSSQSLSFDPPVGLPTGNNSRTIEGWIKLESAVDANGMYILDYGTFTTDQEFGLKIVLSGGNVVGQLDRFGAATTGTVDLGLQIGIYSHLAVTYNGTDLRWYVDGILKDTATVGATLNTVLTNGRIGKRISGTSFADGLIDDVRVWNVERTLQQIIDNKDKQLVGNETNLVAYWKLDNTLLDETVNANTLTISGGAIFSTDTPSEFKGDKLNLDATISTGATTLTIDGDQTGIFANGDTVDISTSDNLVRERKTLTAIPTFATGKTTLTFSATANAFGITDFVERVNVIPQISLVDIGTAKSFQSMTFVRSELGTGTGSTGNGIATNEVEDEYEFTAPTAQEDLKIKLDLTRNDTSLSVFAKRLGVSLNI